MGRFPQGCDLFAAARDDDQLPQLIEFDERRSFCGVVDELFEGSYDAVAIALDADNVRYFGRSPPANDRSDFGVAVESRPHTEPIWPDSPDAHVGRTKDVLHLLGNLVGAARHGDE